ncbi:putative O-methyltransferase/MSMEI 4947 [bioreactor metagenome]|uniref:Putative O-methyltransferase/MSMEI 4947 n=1 Tax=bioreactor metagenome TaxID=1076179 RepID=A0A645AKZ2_9ZZZZ
MRERQTTLTHELLDYLESNFTAEDNFLAELASEAWENEKIPQINITGYQANFLQFLVKSINAKKLLEIGTLAGYSAISLIRAAGEDAKLITIEKEAKHCEFAKNKIKQVGLDNQIEVVNANALSYLQTYKPDFLFDFIFIDADKSRYYKYLNVLTPFLRTGGLFVADNAFAFGFLLDAAPEKNPDNFKSLLNYHKHLLSLENYFTTLVPIGDGLLVSIKLK